MENNILSNIMNPELRRVGAIGDDDMEDEFFYDEVEELEGEVCKFSMNSYDQSLYSITEYKDGSFKFMVEYEGGYQGSKREFKDVEMLKHHCKKLADMLEIQYKVVDIHNHLFDDIEVNREVSLNKLL